MCGWCPTYVAFCNACVGDVLLMLPFAMHVCVMPYLCCLLQCMCRWCPTYVALCNVWVGDVLLMLPFVGDSPFILPFAIHVQVMSYLCCLLQSMCGWCPIYIAFCNVCMGDVLLMLLCFLCCLLQCVCGWCSVGNALIMFLCLSCL